MWWDNRVRFGFEEIVATVGGETEVRKSGLDQDRMAEVGEWL